MAQSGPIEKIYSSSLVFSYGCGIKGTDHIPWRFMDHASGSDL